MSGRLEGRLALVTGASRGIGYAVAKRFAAEGAHVVAVARTQGGLEELDDEVRRGGHGSCTLHPLDLNDFDAIDRMAAALHERFGKLDVAVGNAAILPSLSPVGHVEIAVFEAIQRVNFVANWRLLRALDPLLRRASAGRAIFTTCDAAHAAEPYWGAYAASKAALEALVRAYAAEVANTPVRARLVNPGPVRTRLRLNAFPAEDTSRLPLPDQVAELFVAAASAQ